MPSAHSWTGREVRRIRRSSEIFDLASRLMGRDDFLANLMLEDALYELNGILGERGEARVELAGDDA
jgi:hypothetical protein